jgi:hypothetical protein
MLSYQIILVQIDLMESSELSTDSRGLAENVPGVRVDTLLTLSRNQKVVLSAILIKNAS